MLIHLIPISKGLKTKYLLSIIKIHLDVIKLKMVLNVGTCKLRNLSQFLT